MNPLATVGLENAIDWTTQANISTVITTVIAAFATIFVVLQLRSSILATQAQTYALVINLTQNEEIRQARKIVFSALKGRKPTDWTAKETVAAERVCHTYDAVGQMVRNKYLPKKVIVDSWGPSLRLSWPILSPLVQKYRQEFNANEYWDDYEWLAKEAINRNR